MIKPVMYYEDSSGEVHKDKHEALRADLIAIILDSKQVNMASAVILADYLFRMSDDIVAILEG